MIHYPKLRNMTQALSLSGFNAFKATFLFYLLLEQMVLCRVATITSLPVHHP